MASDEAVRREIEQLHEFFVAWFGGSVAEDAFEEGLSSHLDDEFSMIAPLGNRVTKDALEEGLRARRGDNPDFRIAIRNVAVQRRFAIDGGELIIARYEEWQKHAKASKSANNGRISSVVFRDAGERLLWLQLHETWLPEDVMAAGPYDF